MRVTATPASGGKKPTTPTIGTATDGGTGTTVSVAFTPSTYIGKGTISYTATSSPGSITGTGSGSPITVSGLTTGTAYTFTVNGTTNYGVVSDNSAASNSVTPAVPSSFESIATFTPTSGTSVTFTSIPQTYKSLQLRIIARDGSGGTTGISGNSFYLQPNGDSNASNYSYHRLQGTNSTVNPVGSASGVYTGLQLYGAIYGSASAASCFGVSIIDIIDYASTTKYKTMRAIGGAENNAGGTQTDVLLYSGAYLTTTAITSLTISNGGSFASGTTIALYGIK